MHRYYTHIYICVCIYIYVYSWIHKYDLLSLNNGTFMCVFRADHLVLNNQCALPRGRLFLQLQLPALLSCL